MGYLFGGIVSIILLIGWVINIVAVFGLINAPTTNMFILRCVGILVAPLGSVLGLFF